MTVQREYRGRGEHQGRDGHQKLIEAPVAAEDSVAFRRALGQFATGVAVVTTLDGDGARIGLTVNSFTSVSLDPPLVLWCLGRESPNVAIFESATHFAVNVLAADQKAISQRFADSTLDRFRRCRNGRGVGRRTLVDRMPRPF